MICRQRLYRDARFESMRALSAIELLTRSGDFEFWKQQLTAWLRAASSTKAFWPIPPPAPTVICAQRSSHGSQCRCQVHRWIKIKRPAQKLAQSLARQSEQ
jgi:hypothetical protein